MQDAHQDEESAGHERGNHKAVHTVLLDDPVNDYDEGAGGAANLHLAAAEERNEETGYDGGKDTGLRGSTRSNAKSDGQREGHNTHDNTGQKVLYKVLLGITFLKNREKFRSKISFDSHILLN